ALVSFVGVQTDVTERVRVEREREAAFTAEQAARHEAELARSISEQARADAERAQADAERAQAEAERAQGRLALMAEATSTLISTLDMTELLDRLAGLCVPRLADWVFLTLIDQHGQVAETIGLHRDGRETELARIAQHARHLPPRSPSRRSMTNVRPVLLEDITPELLDEVIGDPEVVAAFQGLG